MSGIVGLFYLDGRPVEASSLRRMASAVAHRGPDGEGVWSEGSAGLGCRILRSTPESRRNGHSVALARNSVCIISADVRLDNRDALLGLLGKTQFYGPVTDEELLIAAYLKWGDRCAEHLLGDFAFAIWDRRREELYCARDHFGIRPFHYYYREGELFAFGSEVKALLALDAVPREVNEVRVADHLACIVVDKEATFYQNVLRLPPGTALRITRSGMRRIVYWQLDPEGEIRLADDRAYAEAFRETLSEAVTSRLRSSTAIGSLLSGGLDSTTITVLANKSASQNGVGRIHTFSTVFEELHTCDESEFIRKILAEGAYEPHFILGDSCDHIGKLRDLIRMCDGPFLGPNAAMRWHLLDEIRRTGIRVVLEGSGGDETVSHGYGYVDDLVRDRRWIRLARELHGLTKIHGDSFFEWLWFLLKKHHLGQARSVSLVRRAFRRAQRMTASRLDGTAHESPSQRDAMISPEFAERIQFKDRFRSWARSLPETAKSERERHYRVLTGPLQPAAFELLDATGAAFSIETRIPFWDKRLVEFSYRLPAEQKLSRGLGRAVMRRAMAPLMPADVVLRRSKTDFLPSLQRALYADSRDSMEEIMNRTQRLEAYVDVGALRDAYERILSRKEGSDGRDVFGVWSVAALSLWLEETENGDGRISDKAHNFWLTPFESNLE